MKLQPAVIRNPVLHLEDIDVRDPAVFIRDGLAHLFFTHFDHRRRRWHIGATTTDDFVTYSDIRLISPSGYASPGNVVTHGDQFVLCYQQYQTFPHTICLSWSDDLMHWSDPVSVFNTDDGNRWNTDGRVIDPYLVRDGEDWICYYTGSTRWGKASGHNFIGAARSADLRTWEDVTRDHPCIGVDAEWEQPDGNENNCVIRYDDRWLMLYSASLKHQRIAWAVSDDLIHWDKRGLCHVPDFPGACSRFGAPFLIERLEGTKPGLHTMIYQGENADGRMSFFLVQSRDLVHWRDPAQDAVN